MALNILSGEDEGSLYWAARLDFSEFDKDAPAAFAKLNARLNELAKDARFVPTFDNKAALAQIGQIEIALAKATSLGFNTQPLYEQLDAIRARIAAAPVEIPATINVAVNDLAELEKLRTQVAEFSQTLRITPQVDAAKALAEVGQIETALNGLTVKGIDTAPLLQQIQSLRASISQQPATLPVNINVESTAAFDTLKTRIAALSKEIQIQPSIDKTRVLSELSDLQQALQKLSIAGIDTNGLLAQLNAVRAQVGEKPIEIPVTVAAGDFTDLKARIAALSDSLRINPSIDTAQVLRQVAQLEQELKTTASVGVDTSQVAQQLDQLKTKVAQLDLRAPVVPQTDAVAFDRLRAQLADLGKEIQITPHLNQEALLTEINQAKGALDKLAILSQQLTVTPTIDKAPILAQVAEIEQALKQIAVSGLDTTVVSRQLATIKTQIEQTGAVIPISVTIDTAAFEQLKVRVSEFSNQLRINPNVDISEAKAQLQALEADLKRATAAGFDSGRLFQQLNEARAKISQSPVVIPAKVQVDKPDLSELDQLKVRVAALSDSLRINPHIDVAQALAEIQEIESALKKATLAGLDTGRLFQQLEAAKSKISKSPIKVPLDIQAGDTAAFEKIRARVAELSNSLVINPKVDATTALAEIEALGLAIKSATASGFDTTALSRDLATLRATVEATPVEVTVTANTLPAIESIETLRARLAVRQQLVVGTTDITKVAALNKEIETLEQQIAQTSSVGRTGFDAMGNKIADTTKKSGILQKSFSFLRETAAILPGIGIAGIIAFLSDAIITLVTDLLKGRDAFNAIAEKIKLFNEVSKEANKAAASQLTDAKVLYKVATDTNASMTERLNAVKALKTEFPDFFKAISTEAILNGQAKKSYDDLTLSIIANAKAQAARAKLVEIESQRLDIEAQRQKIRNATANETAAVKPVSGKNFLGDQALSEESIKQRRAYDLRVIEDRKKAALAEQDVQDGRLKAQADFLVKYAGGEKKLAEVIAKPITAGTGKESKDALREINKLLEERRKLLEQIQDLQNSADRSGLTRDFSELEKIEQKYDKIIRAAKAFNDEAGKAGRANFSIDIAGIEKLRAVEVRNTTLRQDAEEYLKTLDTQKAAFTQYAEAVKEIGVTESQAMFAEQTKGFDSYLDYLKGELNKDNLTAKIYLGIANIGEVLKFRGLVKEIGEETTAEGERQRQRTITAISSAQTLSAKLLKIETDYQKSKAAIEKSYTGSDKAQVLDNLEADKQKSIDAVKDEVFQKTELYKELSENVIRYTRDQLKAQIAATEAVLKNAKNLAPELRKTLENSLKGLKTDLNLGTDDSFIQNLEARKAKILETLQTEQLSTEEYKKQKDALAAINEELAKAGRSNKAGLEKTIALTQTLAQGFNELAQSIAPFNKELSDKFASIGDSLNIAADATKAFLTGNPEDIIKLVTDIAAAFAKVKQSAIDARNEIAEFNQAQQSAQTDYNIEFRERMRQQAGLNKLKLDGLEAENRVLAQQRAANATEAANILKQLQQEQYIAGQHTERTRGSIFGGLVGFFAGTRTNVANEMASLVGKSFEEIERLYLSGRLEGKAKALYESLKKLKEEGANIDAELDRVAQDQREAFTGTTAEAITDTILQGFANGKKAVGDFAEDMRTTIQKALLQAFRYQALEAPIKKLYEQLAADAQSGNVLDPTEIASFQAGFNKTIEDAIKVQAAIEAATGQQLANLNTSGANGNSLAGAIKGIREDQADVMAGRLGGMQMSLVEINQHSLASLRQHEMIQNNTAQTVAEVKKQTATLIDFFQNRGVKIA